ncbi:hypothetical protein [Streptomyces abikoensis]
MTGTDPQQLAPTLTFAEAAHHTLYRLLTAAGRHGEHFLTEESFTWTYTLRRADGTYTTVNAGFREVAEKIAHLVENTTSASGSQIRVIAADAYQAHVAAARVGIHRI